MTLDTDDDAARAVRGKEWRMPTPKEIEDWLTIVLGVIHTITRNMWVIK